MIRDHLVPTIKKNLTKNEIANLMKSIAGYVDRNAEVLMDMNLAERYSFGDSDREIIYKAIGISEEQIAVEIKNSKQIYSGNKIQSNPFYCASFLAMHVLYTMKMEKEAKQIMTYISLMMYTSCHKGFFKYRVNPQIMDYTIAHLDASFKIRSMPSLYAWLDDNAITAYETYTDRLKRADDSDITWVINALWDRVKGKMRKISNAYYENWKSGNYLNRDEDSQSSEDYHEMDNNSFAVDSLANKVYIKLINHQFDDRFLKYAITRSDTSYQKFKNLVDDLIEDDADNEVKKFIAAMIEYYLIMSGRGFEYIPRGEFISYMKSAYASNTEIQQMVYMKTTLENWISEHMVSVGRQNYGKTARLGYKKSLYMFFVFVINHEAKTN